MDFRVILAVFICKALRLVSRILHRGGTALPGRIALKICPELLGILAKDVKTVAITGTNGKTTSARMIEEAFVRQGKSCSANRSGANLISGITTEYAVNSSLSGKCRKEYAVIECDEGAAKSVFRQLKPKVVLVTNLFSDQVDRYGAVTGTLDNIRAAMIPVPETVLCLNADCSLTASLGLDLPNPIRYYGLDRGAAGDKTEPESSDAVRCIRCGKKYGYEYVTYDHLGGFFCPGCGYRRPKADYAVTGIVDQSISGSTVVMDIMGSKKLVNINLPAMYNMYNAAGAFAAVSEMGLGADAAVDALANFKCGFGRMEYLNIGKGGARMTLVKNAAGCNQVLDFLQNVKEKFILVICLNNHVSDGTDLSWLQDARFEKLNELSGRLEHVFVSGERAQEMYDRIRQAGISEDNITLEYSYDKLIDMIQAQDDLAFLMPNYTAMLDFRQAIVDRCGGAEFWE